jgi:hypothetical protein
MPPKEKKKIPDKLTDSEKKKIKQANKAKQNPELAARKKEKKLVDYSVLFIFLTLLSS